MIRTIALAGTLLVATVGIARAADYHPGFACPRPDNTDPLAVAICGDQQMSKAELLFEKTYYAHRQQEGQTAYHALKVKAVAYDKALRAACGIPEPPSTLPISSDARTCYVDHVTHDASSWDTSLQGPAFEEVQRDIDRHIAIQQRLIDLGYLAGSQADGVYGDGTRTAIESWQQAHGMPADGFISDDQAPILLADTARASARPAVPTPGSTPPTDNMTLVRLFSRDMLDVQVPYLETIVGPAKHVDQMKGTDAARTYVVNGCQVTAYVSGTDVTGYGLKLSPTCDVDLSPLANVSTPPTRNGTFGAFQNALGGTFKATCLASCGNSEEPRAFWTWEGPHSSDYIDIELSVVIANDASINASESWEAAMKGEGEDYVTDGKFNCERKYDDAAERAFANVRFDSIFIGHGKTQNDEEVEGDCSSASGTAAAAVSAAVAPTPSVASDKAPEPEAVPTLSASKFADDKLLPLAGGAFSGETGTPEAKACIVALRQRYDGDRAAGSASAGTTQRAGGYVDAPRRDRSLFGGERYLYVDVLLSRSLNGVEFPGSPPVAAYCVLDDAGGIKSIQDHPWVAPL